jgi:hypothetical protein
MSGTFHVIIGTRKITVKPDKSRHFIDGSLPSPFTLTEGTIHQGIMSFIDDSWQHDEKGDLSDVELDAVAEKIINHYR